VLLDIGVNLMSRSFNTDRERVFQDAIDAGVCPLIITGASVADSAAAQKYAERKQGNCYSTAGVHPHDAKSCGHQTIDKLKELLQHHEVVAVGECGLDYNRDFSPRPVQREWFEKQVQLAVELKKPLFLHERDAFEDFFSIIEKNNAGITKMVVHCFTGTEKELSKYLELGCYIGITGWICDERRGTHLLSLVKKIPADKLLLETDAPFLIPRTMPRGNGRNEPKNLVHIAKHLSNILGKDFEVLAEETYRNSCEFFGIEK
jgi:TatD DNase family protein